MVKTEYHCYYCMSITVNGMDAVYKPILIFVNTRKPRFSKPRFIIELTISWSTKRALFLEVLTWYFIPHLSMIKIFFYQRL
jgi:hypothetical protein